MIGGLGMVAIGGEGLLVGNSLGELLGGLLGDALGEIGIGEGELVGGFGASILGVGSAIRFVNFGNSIAVAIAAPTDIKAVKPNQING